MRIKNIVVTFIAVGIASSCVSKSKYKALEDERNKEMEQRKAEEQKGKDLQEKIHKLSSEKEMEKKNLSEALNKSEAEKQADIKREQEKERELMEEIKKRQAELDSRDAQLKNLQEKLKALTDAGKLKVSLEKGRLVIDLSSDILFPSGSARLSKAGQATIREVGTTLAEVKDQKFQVEGYTDNTPIHSAAFASNWDLAAARALTVLKTLLSSGMDSDRISAASYGEQQPVVANDTKEGRAKNRRIEIVIVPDLSRIVPPSAVATPAATPASEEKPAVESTPAAAH